MFRPMTWSLVQDLAAITCWHFCICTAFFPALATKLLNLGPAGHSYNHVCGRLGLFFALGCIVGV
jgi:hypothetical protein